MKYTLYMSYQGIKTSMFINVGTSLKISEYPIYILNTYIAISQHRSMYLSHIL